MSKLLDIHCHLKDDQPQNETLYSFSDRDIPTNFNGYKSVGIHPWYIENSTISWQQIEKQALEPSTLAIGESGLDKNISTSFSKQEQIFIKHIELSEAYKKPLIIHAVKSTPELIALHKEYKPNQLWIIHGFRGKPELYKEYAREGICVSIGQKFNIKTVASIPLDELLVETDDSSEDIQSIIKAISSTKNISPQQLTEQIYKNTTRIFFH